MNANAAPIPASWRQSRWLLAALVLAVVLPGAVAMGLFLTGWRPASLTVHGEFMHPPVQLDTIQITRASGEPTALQALQGKWTLLYLQPADCQRDCVASLYGMRMVEIGQGEHSLRVQRLVVSASAEQARLLAQRDAGLISASADAAQLAQLRQRLILPEGGAAPIYLMDPLGNVILRYGQDVDPTGIRKDLSHLIKHSWVG